MSLDKLVKNLDEIKDKNLQKNEKNKKQLRWLLPMVILIWGLIYILSSDDLVHKYEETTLEGKFERALNKFETIGGESKNKIISVQFLEQFGGEYEGKNLLTIEYHAVFPFSKPKEEVLREAFEMLGKVAQVESSVNIGEVFLKPYLETESIDQYGKRSSHLRQTAKIIFPYSKAKNINPSESYNFKADHFKRLFSTEGRNFKWFLRK